MLLKWLEWIKKKDKEKKEKILKSTVTSKFGKITLSPIRSLSHGESLLSSSC